MPGKTTAKKYEPLGAFLANLKCWETQITLTFEQVEIIIGADLPYSAFHYRPWWANQKAGSRASHWHKAGFKVKTVDMKRKLVSFTRLNKSPKDANGITPHKQKAASSEFKPGLTKKLSRLTASLTERELNKALRHNDIQFALGQYLIRCHGEDKVGDEFLTVNGKRVDLVVKDENDMIYYEIKVCESAQHCIRQAIGQLLEYSYWPNVIRATKLVVVGEAKLDKDAQDYLDILHKEFRLPIHYQQFEWESKTLRNNEIYNE